MTVADIIEQAFKDRGFPAYVEFNLLAATLQRYAEVSPEFDRDLFAAILRDYILEYRS